MEKKEMKNPMELEDDVLNDVSGGIDYSESLVCSVCGESMTALVVKCPLCGGTVVVKSMSPANILRKTL